MLMNIQTAIITYLALINIITFIMYGADKYKAIHNQWRIPEATLITAAIIGGSIGAWCGMKVWHHKTMHLKFKYGVPLIFILQMTSAIYLLTNY